MKIIFLPTFWLLFFCLFVKNTEASHPISDFNKENESPHCQIRKVFSEFLKTKGKNEPINLVLGCGQNHKVRTVSDQLHNHDGAFTIDLKPGRLNPYGVTNPHFTGDVFDLKILGGLPQDVFDEVKIEHINKDIISSAKESHFFLRALYRTLKPGGKLLYLSGGMEHRILTPEKAENIMIQAGFSVVKSSLIQKLPQLSLGQFYSLSQAKQQKLIKRTLLEVNENLWRVVLSEERKLYPENVFGDCAYLEVLATKPLPKPISNEVNADTSFRSDCETMSLSYDSSCDGFSETEDMTEEWEEDFETGLFN